MHVFDEIVELLAGVVPGEGFWLASAFGEQEGFGVWVGSGVGRLGCAGSDWGQTKGLVGALGGEAFC